MLEGGDCTGDDAASRLTVVEDECLDFATGRGFGRGRADMMIRKGRVTAWEIDCILYSEVNFRLFNGSFIMDSSSVIFKKSKSRPGQRAREKSPEGISQTSSGRAESAEESPIALASRLKNKAKRTKPKSTLSFGDDEEVRVFT